MTVVRPLCAAGWTWDTSGIAGGGAAQTFAADPFNANGATCGGDSWGVYNTTNAGNKWFSANKGLGVAGQVDPVAGDFFFMGTAYSIKFPGRVYCLTGKLENPGAGNFGYVFGNSYTVVSRAINGGESTATGGNRGDHPRPLGQRVVVDYDSATGTEWIYVGTGNGGGVARSSDAGAHWTVIGLSGTGSAICSMCLDPNDHTKLYVGTRADKAYLLSNIRGSASSTHLNNAPAKVQSLAGFGGNIYAAGGTAGVFKVTGNGATWTSLGGTTFTSTGSIWSAVGGTGSTIYVGCTNPSGNKSVAKSTDNGSTWSWITPPSNINLQIWGRSESWWLANYNPAMVPGNGGTYFVQVIDVDKFDSQIVYLCGKSGVWKSTDGGTNWRPAVYGLNGTMHQHIKAAASGGQAWTNDTDWNGQTTSDYFATATQQNAPTFNAPTLSLTHNGHTYELFLNAVRDFKVDGVSIADEFFRASCIRANDIAVSGNDDHIYVAQDGGGVLVATLSGSPPNPPTNLAATAGNGQAALTWTAAAGATSYNVKRGTTNGGPYPTVVGVSTTSYTSTGLTNGTTYYFVVTAVNGNGESGNSNQASATPTAPPPPAPTNLSATAGDQQASLSWTASAGATSYKVKRATVSGGPYTTIAPSVTATSYLDTPLTNGTTYYYVVTAVNSGGESGNSNQASATPQVPAPAAPTDLTATAGNAQVALLWMPSSGATSYNVKRSTTSGSGYTTVAPNVTGTSYTNTSLTNGTTYYYVVTAVNAGGESGNSNEASATPTASATVGEFVAEDIGSPALTGSTSFASGVYTVAGAGVDIYSTSDQFRFAHENWSDGVSVVARVTQVQNTHGWAKAALMIRDGVAANAAHVTLALTPSNGVQLLHRASTGGTTTSDAIIAGFAAPYWLRLERHGNIFTGYDSPDGRAWFLTGSVTIALPTAEQVGLAVTSHNTAAVNTSLFDNVAVALPQTWVSADVGSPGATGSASVNYATDTYTVVGSGANIWTGTDAFQFYYQTWDGDGTFVAEVKTVQNTNNFAKAGIMIRHNLTANSAHGIVDLTPGAGAEFNRRLNDGDATTVQNVTAGLVAPYFIKLVRVGNSISAYTSPTGGTWTQLGTAATISLGTGSVYVGLAVCSHAAGTLNTSTFDSVYFAP